MGWRVFNFLETNLKSSRVIPREPAKTENKSFLLFGVEIQNECRKVFGLDQKATRICLFSAKDTVDLIPIGSTSCTLTIS